MYLPQGPQLTPGVSRTAWEVTGYGFIYVGVGCNSGECVWRVPPSSFPVTLAGILRAYSIKEPIPFTLPQSPASFRSGDAGLSLAICEVSYLV